MHRGYTAALLALALIPFFAFAQTSGTSGTTDTSGTSNTSNTSNTTSDTSSSGSADSASASTKVKPAVTSGSTAANNKCSAGDYTCTYGTHLVNGQPETNRDKMGLPCMLNKHCDDAESCKAIGGGTIKGLCKGQSKCAVQTTCDGKPVASSTQKLGATGGTVGTIVSPGAVPPNTSKLSAQPLQGGNSILDSAFSTTPLSQQKTQLTGGTSAGVSSAGTSGTGAQASNGTSAAGGTSKSSANVFNQTNFAQNSFRLQGGTLPGAETKSIQTTKTTKESNVQLNANNTGFGSQQTTASAQSSDCGWWCKVTGYFSPANPSASQANVTIVPTTPTQAQQQAKDQYLIQQARSAAISPDNLGTYTGEQGGTALKSAQSQAAYAQMQSEQGTAQSASDARTSTNVALLAQRNEQRIQALKTQLTGLQNNGGQTYCTSPGQSGCLLKPSFALTDVHKAQNIATTKAQLATAEQNLAALNAYQNNGTPLPKKLAGTVAQMNAGQGSASAAVDAYSKPYADAAQQHFAAMVSDAKKLNVPAAAGNALAYVGDASVNQVAQTAKQTGEKLSAITGLSSVTGLRATAAQTAKCSADPGSCSMQYGFNVLGTAATIDGVGSLTEAGIGMTGKVANSVFDTTNAWTDIAGNAAGKAGSSASDAAVADTGSSMAGASSETSQGATQLSVRSTAAQQDVLAQALGGGGNANSAYYDYSQSLEGGSAGGANFPTTVNAEVSAARTTDNLSSGFSSAANDNARSLSQTTAVNESPVVSPSSEGATALSDTGNGAGSSLLETHSSPTMKFPTINQPSDFQSLTMQTGKTEGLPGSVSGSSAGGSDTAFGKSLADLKTQPAANSPISENTLPSPANDNLAPVNSANWTGGSGYTGLEVKPTPPEQPVTLGKTAEVPNGQTPQESVQSAITGIRRQSGTIPAESQSPSAPTLPNYNIPTADIPVPPGNQPPILSKAGSDPFVSADTQLTPSGVSRVGTKIPTAEIPKPYTGTVQSAVQNPAPFVDSVGPWGPRPLTGESGSLPTEPTSPTTAPAPRTSVPSVGSRITSAPDAAASVSATPADVGSAASADSSSVGASANAGTGASSNAASGATTRAAAAPRTFTQSAALKAGKATWWTVKTAAKYRKTTAFLGISGYGGYFLWNAAQDQQIPVTKTPAASPSAPANNGTAVVKTPANPAAKTPATTIAKTAAAHTTQQPGVHVVPVGNSTAALLKQACIQGNARACMQIAQTGPGGGIGGNLAQSAAVKQACIAGNAQACMAIAQQHNFGGMYQSGNSTFGAGRFPGLGTSMPSAPVPTFSPTTQTLTANSQNSGSASGASTYSVSSSGSSDANNTTNTSNTNTNSSSGGSASVTKTPDKKPVVTLIPNPRELSVSGTVTLTWASVNTSNCSIVMKGANASQPDYTLVKDGKTDGSIPTPKLTVSTTFLATCTPGSDAIQTMATSDTQVLFQ